MRIAVVTNETYAELSPGDQLMKREFEARGIEAVPCIWSNPGINWHQFDVILIRTPWNYYLAFDAFLEWLDVISKTNRPVINPVPLMRANLDKTYLRAMSALGLPVIPTEFYFEPDRADLAAVARWDAREVIVKPSISAGAFATYRVPGQQPDAICAAMGEVRRVAHPHAAIMVQPFCDIIETQGEYSFLYFGGSLAYVVQKVPARGDYRVQPQHGGISTVVDVPLILRQAVDAIYTGLDIRAAYARLDLIVTDGRPLIMEVELVEPNLFFELVPQQGPQMFVDAVLNWLGLALERSAK